MTRQFAVFLITLKETSPAGGEDLMIYFEEHYVRVDQEAVGDTVSRFSPALWNQRESALTGTHAMNNISEGWHNPFQIAVGRYHPDLYTAITEFHEEQPEVALAELAAGKSVKA